MYLGTASDAQKFLNSFMGFPEIGEKITASLGTGCSSGIF
jgi:hypothetical protein